MLEAHVREYRSFSATPANAERECKAGDDLKAGGEVDRGAQPG